MVQLVINVFKFLRRDTARVKVRGKAEHLYSALHGIHTTLKRSGMDHTV